MVLDRIERPNDIKKIDPSEYAELASEIRGFLIDKVSVTGGHLASNLGVVELTMALHLFMNLPKDKLIWDVGHQSYTHKLLTGRKSGFDSLSARSARTLVVRSRLIAEVKRPPLFLPFFSSSLYAERTFARADSAL